MMRLPDFRYLAPRTRRARRRRCSPARGPRRMLRRRRHRSPPEHEAPASRRRASWSGCARVAGAARSVANGERAALGAGLTLTDARARRRAARGAAPGLCAAAAQVATPHLRNMGTLGGNLCLDTRCNYYDQSYEWRKAIDFCMKKDGDDVLGGAREPALLGRLLDRHARPRCSLSGARVAPGRRRRATRVLPLEELYADDGIRYLTKRPDEILTEVLLEPLPTAGAAPTGSCAAAAPSTSRCCRSRRPRASARAGWSRRRAWCSAPWPAGRSLPDAAALLAGRELTDAAIEEVARARPAPPSRWTTRTSRCTGASAWSREVVAWALRDLRGDDMRDLRRRVARHGWRKGPSSGFPAGLCCPQRPWPPSPRKAPLCPPSPSSWRGSRSSIAQGRVRGYEMLFRDGIERTLLGETDRLAGFDWPVLTRGRDAWINCTREVLLAGRYQALPPEHTVVELLEDVEPDLPWWPPAAT